MEAVTPLLSAIQKLNKYGVKNYRIFVYVLVRDIPNADRRCNILKRLGVTPFAQPYRDFESKKLPTREQRDFARYVNRKEIFNSCDYGHYNRIGRVTKDTPAQAAIFSDLKGKLKTRLDKDSN
jgi:hypothetical protein